jgi:hypothetical protein
MAFNSLAALLVAAAREGLPPAATILDLGNQRFKAKSEVLQRIQTSFVSSNSSLIKPQILRSLMTLPPKEAEGRVADFYRALGFRSYQAIDVNANFGSQMMDLNRLLVEDYGFTERFDLVVNNGTGEHIFNQAAVFKNMHDACAAGGLMLHIMPFVNYQNHGFYSFHPVLYCDIAEANAYRIEAIGVGSHSGDLRVLCGGMQSDLLLREIFPLETVRRSIRGVGHRPLPLRQRLRRTVTQLLGRTAPVAPWQRLERVVAQLLADTARADDTKFPNLLVFALLRRDRDGPFQVPFQGKYVGAIQNEEIRAAYAPRGPRSAASEIGTP